MAGGTRPEIRPNWRSGPLRSAPGAFTQKSGQDLYAESQQRDIAVLELQPKEAKEEGTRRWKALSSDDQKSWDQEPAARTWSEDVHERRFYRTPEELLDGLHGTTLNVERSQRQNAGVPIFTNTITLVGSKIKDAVTKVSDWAPEFAGQK